MRPFGKLLQPKNGTLTMLLRSTFSPFFLLQDAEINQCFSQGWMREKENKVIATSHACIPSSSLDRCFALCSLTIPWENVCSLWVLCQSGVCFLNMHSLVYIMHNVNAFTLFHAKKCDMRHKGIGLRWGNHMETAARAPLSPCSPGAAWSAFSPL